MGWIAAPAHTEIFRRFDDAQHTVFNLLKGVIWPHRDV